MWIITFRVCVFGVKTGQLNKMYDITFLLHWLVCLVYWLCYVLCMRQSHRFPTFVVCVTNLFSFSFHFKLKLSEAHRTLSWSAQHSYVGRVSQVVSNKFFWLSSIAITLVFDRGKLYWPFFLVFFFFLFILLCFFPLVLSCNLPEVIHLVLIQCCIPRLLPDVIISGLM